MSDLLLEAVERHAAGVGTDRFAATVIDGVWILRADGETQPSHLVFKPVLCVVVQGAKWTTFGNRRFDYRAGQALVVSVEMPAVGRVTEASPDKPFLGVVIALDAASMREVLDGLDAPPPAGDDLRHGVFVTEFDGPLADCVRRLVCLLDTPRAIALLRPAIMREICYWLLTSPQGGAVARMTLGHGHAPRVLGAVHALRARYAEPVRLEALAAIARLSPSAFHRQFKAVTSMTPLQYQKQLRLLEARRLMVSGMANVEAAAFRVGYESPSQFSREYARMFGTPPRRDVATLRLAAA